MKKRNESFTTEEGRNQHKYMVKNVLPKVLKEQDEKGFYDVEDHSKLEKELLEAFEKGEL
ncbi:MAG: hypothetical protein RSA91_00495 [Bacilli bacterium]